MIGKSTTGNRQSIEADQGRAWVAEGERAARGGEPIESNPYDGRGEQVPRLLWLRGYLYSRGTPARAAEPRWS